MIVDSPTLNLDNMIVIWNTLLNICVQLWNFICNFGLGMVAVLIVISIFINTLDYIRGGDSRQSNTYIHSEKGIKY